MRQITSMRKMVNVDPYEVIRTLIAEGILSLQRMKDENIDEHRDTGRFSWTFPSQVGEFLVYNL